MFHAFSFFFNFSINSSQSEDIVFLSTCRDCVLIALGSVQKEKIYFKAQFSHCNFYDILVVIETGMGNKLFLNSCLTQIHNDVERPPRDTHIHCRLTSAHEIHLWRHFILTPLELIVVDNCNKNVNAKTKVRLKRHGTLINDGGNWNHTNNSIKIDWHMELRIFFFVLNICATLMILVYELEIFYICITCVENWVSTFKFKIPIKII